MNPERDRQHDNETDTAAARPEQAHEAVAPQQPAPADASDAAAAQPASEQAGIDASPPTAESVSAPAAESVPGAAAETTAGLAADPAQLNMLLEDARAKADQAHDQLLRTRAEMENMSRRQAKELENAHKFALEGFIKELLQVRDSLELGHAAAQAPDADVAKLREGTELTLKLLSDTMSKFGVERVDPEGEPFNPDYHQAMSMQPRPDLPANTVTNVIQSGYTLNGRLVRPALVMVSSQA
ncbi:nucleotide exchange factor GrpE [uncultured Thiohalocapsa sp.]|uniref:nucleotide exchange factor GrpE n=1 Tax=uncultured Thiohalocapsa sp. TaxID=768990 RepID=UPI0025DBB467|nr:nucleotide exchange factor GrpE [uncultured Thiohalocapsa sp.]